MEQMFKTADEIYIYPRRSRTVQYTGANIAGKNILDTGMMPNNIIWEYLGIVSKINQAFLNKTLKMFWYNVQPSL